MPRVTKAMLEEENSKLREENSKLREELERLRSRSRSPRVADSALTHTALCMVSRDMREFIRDPAIEELQSVVLQQKARIAALECGEGPIGKVLLAIRQKKYESVSERHAERMAKETESVASVIFGIVEPGEQW